MPRYLIVRSVMVAFVAVMVAFGAGAQPRKSLVAAPADVSAAIEASVPSAERAPQRWALVIGANDYADDRIPDLPECQRDAAAVASALSDPRAGMFPEDHVTYLAGRQVTREAITAALDDLGRQAGSDDLVVIFFSGRGAQDDRDRSYWVMHDTDPTDLRATAMPESEITELIEDIRTTRLVTMIDACFSEATAEVTGAKSLLDLDSIFPDCDGEGRVILTSSRGDQKSVVIREGEGMGYSAFAWHVVNGLKGAADGSTGRSDDDGVVTVAELWTYVKDRTEATARRQGGEQRPTLKGEIGSNFMLTIDADRLVARHAAMSGRVTRLRELAVAGDIDTAQFKLGEWLLGTNVSDLDKQDQKRRKAFVAMLDGTLDPRLLQGTLDAVETPAERAPVERERRAAAEAAKAERVRGQLAAAQAAIAAEDYSEAETQLKGALAVDPGNTTARSLLDQIKRFLGPTHGERKTISLGDGVMMEFVFIDAPGVAPDGFLMGSPASEEGHWYFEDQRRVILTKGYWLQTTEVTQAQWQQVMGANPSYSKGSGQLPVESVSWDEVQRFIERLNGRGIAARMPTEAEWEFAARAGTTTPFHTGSTVSTSQANYRPDRKAPRGKTNSVGSFMANAWGLHDMIGNVQEWCSDWYDEYPSGPESDPTGARSANWRVIRGGSYGTFARQCRSAARLGFFPDSPGSSIGCRLALDLRP